MPSVCAVVPVYDHERAIAGTVAGLRTHGLPVILVDDGSGPACAAELDRLASEDEQLRLVRAGATRTSRGAPAASSRSAAATRPTATAIHSPAG